MLPILLNAVHAASGESLVGSGPLRVHPDNPIWLTDDSGRGIFLAGSHTWANRQERGVRGQTPDFDYGKYLDFMQGHGQDFMRLWAWEHAQWMQFAGSEAPVRYEPLPWPRPGPGNAKDGLPKFDVSGFDEGYFKRLRERVVAAGERGIYVAVMLFQGFSVEQKGTQGVDPKLGNPWDGHPFNAANNVNGIDGDLNGDGEGMEVHTLASPEVTRLQEAYVRKTIDTLNDLDHIVWEIGNECHPGSVEWHYHLIRFIKDYEAAKPKQHLVGMTGAPLKNPEMFASPADWISPIGKRYLNDPPINDGKKIVVVDTDHISPWGNDPAWVWKNLFRGNHFILMDGYLDFRLGAPEQPKAEFDPVRRAMGDAVRLANRLDLATLKPHGELASTGYCLADPGKEYLVYAPKGGSVTVDLTTVEGEFAIEWLGMTTADAMAGDRVTGGAKRVLTASADGEALVRLRRRP